MKNSIEQTWKIIRGSDNTQNVSAMYDRINANRATIDRALQVQAFFSAGWFRLWRKDVLNKKVHRRDAEAFGELNHLRRTIV